jgi:hypothetical protein
MEAMMPEYQISLEPRGDDYVLVRIADDGTETEMPLSKDNVLTLAQSALRLQDHIHAERSRPGVSALTVTPVSQVALHTDVHVTEIHLTMTLRSGVEMTFSLPSTVAKPLAEHLHVLISKIENQERKHTKQ